MKKLLALALSIASLGFVGSTAEAKTPSNSPTITVAANALLAPQFGRQDRGRQDRGRQDRWDRRDNHRARTTIQTRYVRFGWRVYRETYLIRFFPNGRVETRLISRERVR